jgi:aspartate/methionine/tyrosine aminotransferase
MDCSSQYKFKNYEFLASCTASQSMEVVANFLRLKKLNTYLIEPTFDNIPDILKRHKIDLFPLSEKQFKNISALKNTKIDTIFLTLPNNPTGQILNEEEFNALAKFCSDNSIILIIDACFRLFDERMLYDWYAVFSQYKMNFIIIEDTGKIWPTQDLKVSFIISDKDTIKSLARISSDFLLNISPFILKLVIEVAKSSKQNKFKDFRDLLKTNRKYLIEIASKSNFFEIVNPDSRVSVILLKINFDINANDLVDYLFEKGIGLLPGTPFFWDNTKQGENFIRIALARNVEYFKSGIDKLFYSVNLLINGK